MSLQAIVMHKISGLAARRGFLAAGAWMVGAILLASLLVAPWAQPVAAQSTERARQSDRSLPQGPAVAHAPTPLPQIVLVPTDVRYVRAVPNMNIRHGPTTAYPVVGKLAAGQSTAVLAVTFDGLWWQVVCPVGVYGDCFVSANRAHTVPIAEPGSQGNADDLGGVVLTDLRVEVVGTWPVQVQAILGGYIPDPCTAVYSVEQLREGNRIRLRLGTTRRSVCTQVVRPYDEVVLLDVSGWPAGFYDVAVGDLVREFQLPGTQPPVYEVVGTPVKYVLVRADVPVYEGPGSNFAVAGYVRAGEIAQVTGVTADNRWWRIFCTGSASRQCFMNAAFGDPTGEPGVDQHPVVPTGVQYVMAQVDIPVYEGPGGAYMPAGSLFAGMIARVNAVTADGHWWRIDCTETTARECFVSADPAQTLPTASPNAAP